MKYTILEDHEDRTPRLIAFASLDQYVQALSYCYNNLCGDHYSPDYKTLTITFYTASSYVRYICEKL